MSTENKKIFVESYFPTRILYADLPEGLAQNSQWLKHIYKWRENDAEGIERTNVKKMGAWHSRDDMKEKEEFSSMCNMILGAASAVFENLGYAKDTEPVIDNMWVNISPPLGYNRAHTHPGTILSGVYYVHLPEDDPGNIIFKDPRVQADVLLARFDPDREEDSWRWAEVYYKPIEGRIIFFPSWLLHEVEVNMSEAAGDEANRYQCCV